MPQIKCPLPWLICLRACFNHVKHCRNWPFPSPSAFAINKARLYSPRYRQTRHDQCPYTISRWFLCQVVLCTGEIFSVQVISAILTYSSTTDQRVMHSVIDYGLALTIMAQTNLLKLDRVQNQAVRVILGTTKDH